MNGGNLNRRRKNGLSPYFALSIAGHLLLIAVLGYIGLSVKPELAERLPFRVGLALAQAPEAVPSPEPVAQPLREPQPVVERKPEPGPEPVREERNVEPVAEAKPTPVQEPAPAREPVSAPVEMPVAATFEPVDSPAPEASAASLPVESPVDLPERESFSPPAEPDPALTLAYLEHISDMVDGAKRYPPLAMRRRLQGRVMVAATLDSEGGVIEASIAEDPDPLLSEAALKALRNAAPFGPLPEGRETLQVSVPVRFRLTR